MKNILSHQDLAEQLAQHEKVWLLLYKKGTEQNDLALENLQRANKNSQAVFQADVSNVKDIHSEYGVTGVPAFLQFKNSKLTNIFKGAQSVEQYQNILQGGTFSTSVNKKQKTKKSVIVYTTPTCSWCNTLKSYLKSIQIQFNEIDVSRDEKMAQRMVQKSGQQGVPQTEINGQMIVGFDQNRINQLLEIK